jgi:hypothetical protein
MNVGHSAHLPMAVNQEIFYGMTSVSSLPVFSDFSQVLPSIELVRPFGEVFQSAFSSSSLPLSVQKFGIVLSSAELTKPFTAQDFFGSSGYGRLPERSFIGVGPAVFLPMAVSPEIFRGTSSLFTLPGPPDFNQITPSATLVVPLTFDEFIGLNPYANLPGELFIGAKADLMLTQPYIKQSFSGAESLSYLSVSMPFKKFAPIVPMSTLSGRAMPSFEEISLSVFMPMPTTSENFFGMITEGKLPEVHFRGVMSQSALPQVVSAGMFSGIDPVVYLQPDLPRRNFDEISVIANLPVPSPLIFEENVMVDQTKLMFPGGAMIVPSYGLGIPLGAEKPLMEPEIQVEEVEK